MHIPMFNTHNILRIKKLLSNYNRPNSNYSNSRSDIVIPRNSIAIFLKNNKNYLNGVSIYLLSIFLIPMQAAIYRKLCECRMQLFDSLLYFRIDITACAMRQIAELFFSLFIGENSELGPMVLERLI